VPFGEKKEGNQISRKGGLQNRRLGKRTIPAIPVSRSERKQQSGVDSAVTSKKKKISVDGRKDCLQITGRNPSQAELK